MASALEKNPALFLPARGAVAVVFGATGLLGRHLVPAFAAAGWRLRCAVRRVERALWLKNAGEIGQIELVAADCRQNQSLAAAIDGADCIVNLTGQLAQKRSQSFALLHESAPAFMAQEAARQKIKAFVHMSALGAAARAASFYGRSKYRGEEKIRAVLPDAVIIRPSLIFAGEGDFFHQMARRARLSPFLPLPSGGTTQFQPVYAGDAAAAALRALDHNRRHSGRTKAPVYEIGGAEVYSFRQLMALILHCAGLRRLLLPVPLPLMQFTAFFAQYLPSSPITPDQMRMLKDDAIVSAAARAAKRDCAGLGITPLPLPPFLRAHLASGS